MDATSHDPAQPLADLVEPGMFVMLTTMIGDEHSSRPLTVAEVHDGTLSFLVDRSTDWMQAVITGTARTHATVADVKRNVFLSLDGRTTMSDDRLLIDGLWNPGASVYFEGPEDPSVVALQFHVTGGEYWDAPAGGRVGRVLSVVRAAFGSPDDAGDHGPVST